MDFRQFAGVGVNQLRARNSRGNNGQDPELGTAAILPGVRSREQGLYTGSVYPAFTIQLFNYFVHLIMPFCNASYISCAASYATEIPFHPLPAPLEHPSKSVYFPHFPPTN